MFIFNFFHVFTFIKKSQDRIGKVLSLVTKMFLQGKFLIQKKTTLFIFFLIFLIFTQGYLYRF